MCSSPGRSLTSRARSALPKRSGCSQTLADAPREALRDAVLDGVRRLLALPSEREQTNAPSSEGGVSPRSRGRPKRLTPSQVATARRLHSAGQGADDIARALGVSRATVYRQLSDT